jgi:hypothetical protein
MIGAFFANNVPAVRYIFYSEPQNKKDIASIGAKEPELGIFGKIVIKCFAP